MPVQHSMRMKYLSHSNLSSNEAVQGTQDAASGRYTLELRLRTDGVWMAVCTAMLSEAQLP